MPGCCKKSPRSKALSAAATKKATKIALANVKKRAHGIDPYKAKAKKAPAKKAAPKKASPCRACGKK